MRRARCLWLLIFAVSCVAAQDYDVLIRNGRVVDGSGNPWVDADVGIIGDRIAFVGHAADSVTARQTIDARGKVVAPGFIDMLGQSEYSLLIDRQAVSKLTQGITTEITGEGNSVAPVNATSLAELQDFLRTYGIAVDWQSLDEYFRRLEQQGMAINLGTFVGAAQVRQMVLGNEDRAPTAGELARMQTLVEDAMYDGAMGLSTSLIYPPGSFATTDELLTLARMAARHGGIYASHIRDEGAHIQPALEEAFRIGREAGLPVEIWHLKVAGRPNWGKMGEVIAAIERARAAGLDVTADLYPYVASATTLSAIVPPKYQEGGTEAYLARLRDPAQRAAIRRDLETGLPGFENMWQGLTGPEGILVVSVLSPELKRYEGRNLAEIAAEQKKDPLDAALDLIIADHNNVGAVYFEMNEEDVLLALRQPWVAVDTDAGATNPQGPLGATKTHPRAYGSFTRILGKYVREEKLLRLEAAIRKFTSLPAQRMKLADRGLLRPGYFADITIFDPATVRDLATFADPHQPSAGIEYVFVNGVLALEHGKVTGRMGGRPLRGPGWLARDYSPDGLPPRGQLQGVVTDEEGWPLPRTSVTLFDAAGKALGNFTTRKDGRYQIPHQTECRACRLRAERAGFATAEAKVDYNGANSLWFSFALHRLEPPAETGP
ncbi:MAG TPA: amidohydrolase family protein [Terriglobales bacterium]|nr:amidohydrolase family protein [Terriglobales bacterium]